MHVYVCVCVPSECMFGAGEGGACDRLVSSDLFIYLKHNHCGLLLLMLLLLVLFWGRGAFFWGVGVGST